MVKVAAQLLAGAFAVVLFLCVVMVGLFMVAVAANGGPM